MVDDRDADGLEVVVREHALLGFVKCECHLIVENELVDDLLFLRPEKACWIDVHCILAFLGVANAGYKFRGMWGEWRSGEWICTLRDLTDDAKLWW